MAVVGRVVEDQLAWGGVNNGDRGSLPSEVVEVGGIGYFSADDGLHGRELWKILPGASQAQLVEDAVPGGGIAAGAVGSYPTKLTNIGGTLYFQASDPTHGAELWRLNGSGIAELVEVEGVLGGISEGSYSSYPSELTDVGGTLYFAASNTVVGRELWRIGGSGKAEVVEDGLPGGGIRPGVLGSQPGFLTEVSGQLFFRANDGTTGTELWRVGPGGNAALVEDSVAGGGIASGTYESYPAWLTNFGGTLYFSAFQPEVGVELWRVSGSGDAVLVDDTTGGDDGIGLSFAGSYPEGLTASGGTLYFRAANALVGYELWKINGAGLAELVEDALSGGGLNPGNFSSYPNRLTDHQGILYFNATTANDGAELWRVNSSGVAEIVSRAGSVGIHDGALGSNPEYLTSVGGVLYFSANDGSQGVELWRVAGSGLAELVEDNIPGDGLAPLAASSFPRLLTRRGDSLFFSATNSASGTELWWIDGVGTARLVGDGVMDGGINPGAADADPANLSAVGGSLFFSADDGMHGVELWQVGLSGIASLVSATADPVGLNGNSADAFPQPLAFVNGTLYFSAFDGRNGRELWRMSGNGPAELVEDSLPGGGLRAGAAGSNPRDLLAVGGTVYFTADTEAGVGIWRIQPSGQAELLTEKLATGGIPSGSLGINSAGLTEAAGILYFIAEDAATGNELWRITGGGSVELVEINPGPGSSDPGSLTNVGGVLYFVAREPAVGQELWKVGPLGNALLVEDAAPGGGLYPGSDSSSPQELIEVSGQLYFQANDGTNGRELWSVNSTGVAFMIEDAVGGNGIHPTFGSYPSELTNVSGKLYFQADDGSNGLELWQVNTAGVAEMIEDAVAGGGINPGSGRSNPRELTNIAGTLYFNANNALNGYELWRIGPLGIAELVEDSLAGGGIRPGTESSGPSQLTELGGTAYFVANDGTNGVELWRVDSGSGLAEMVEDAVALGGLHAGDASSYPLELTNVGGTLYFSAFQSTTGRELWSLPPLGVASKVEGPSAGGEILPGVDSSEPVQLINASGQLYYVADAGPSYGVELMRLTTNAAPTVAADQVTVDGTVGVLLSNTGTWSDPESDSVSLSASLGSVVRNSQGTWSWSYLPGIAINQQMVVITATDLFGSSSTTSFSISAAASPASVVQRRIFYNRSTSSIFGDGSGNPIHAIDSGKNALLPGQTSTFANYTNYVRGLNGLIVDIADLRGTPTASDFEFAVWNGISAAGFVPLTASPAISLIPGGGQGGSARIKLEFADGAVRNTWLRVTILANAQTGLAANDVFYFGNAVGDFDAGNLTGPPVTVRTNATDTSAVRQNQSTGLNSAPITNIYDLNKDGRVNATDTSLVRQNQASNVLRYFTAPSSLMLATDFSTIDPWSSGSPDVAGQQLTADGEASKLPESSSSEPRNLARGASLRSLQTVSSPPPGNAETDVVADSGGTGSTATSGQGVDSLSASLLMTIDRYFATL
jgi:ELWxxDGT repeat protein